MLITLCLIILGYMIVGKDVKPLVEKLKLTVNQTIVYIILTFVLVSCGAAKSVQYISHDLYTLPERVKFNLNYSDEELAELGDMKLMYFPAFSQSDDSLLNTLLDCLIDSHLKSFAPSKLDPGEDWRWYQGTDKFFAEYYNANGVQYDSLDFNLKDLAVDRMENINFDPTCDCSTLNVPPISLSNVPGISE